MATRTRLQIAKEDIFKRFDDSPTQIFKQTDIARILKQERGFWRLAQSTHTEGFIDFLVRAGRLKPYHFPFPSRPGHVYTWGEVPLLEVLLAIRPHSYFSYYTAVRIHGLTEQAPKTLYVTHEPVVRDVRARSTVTQSGIDAAFRKPARGTQEVVDYQDLRICLINGAGTGMQGVTQTQTASDIAALATVNVTNIERTLIDITVRPAYAGGVAEVLDAYREAKSKASTNRLRATLEHLKYVYPFHQAIGFYLERAGYSPSGIELFRQIPRPLRFYLAHGITETEFVPEWNLFIPKGL